MFEITGGKLKKAQKVVLYGPEGIGKSTFASQFPSPIFIDTEGSTTHLDVQRFDKPRDWNTLLKMVDFIKKDSQGFKTLVIDTADWAEDLAIKHICSTKGVNGIEDFGYGKGYTYLAEEFSRLLNSLSELADSGVNVLILAHAQMRKFEQPDEMGAYDRWELKLQRKTSPLLKEWADAVLFANYKTTIVTDSKTKSKKATGGKRVMYTSHHPAWDAKNRWGLDEELELGVKEIIPHLLTDDNSKAKEEKKAKDQKDLDDFDKQITEYTQYFEDEEAGGLVEINKGVEVDKKDLEGLKEISKDDFEKKKQASKTKPVQVGFDDKDEGGDLEEVKHEKLRDLMKENKVSVEEIENAVAQQGFFPMGTKIQSYPTDFIDQVLVGSWDQVLNSIKSNRKLAEVF